MRSRPAPSLDGSGVRCESGDHASGDPAGVWQGVEYGE